LVYDLIAKLWPESDSVYDLTAIDNRYSIGDRTAGVQWDADGGLTV
jgi:hypothetical protein